MREIFFMGIIGMIVFGGIGYFLWTLFVELYYDFHLRKDVKAIKRDNEDRMRQRDEDNVERLSNGCEHEFGSTQGGFPANACVKCGLEKERPSGLCDHVWKRTDDAVPTARCELCKRKFGGKIADGSNAFS
jgi:hypothetical protein